MIDYQEILKDKLMSSNNPEWLERYNHSLGVTKTALALNKELKLGLNEDKVYLAAILHDYAKFDGFDRCKEIVEKYNLDKEILNISHKLWHSFFGPYIINDELGIDDKEILDAIRYHTTGKPNMNVLEEVIFLSDYIEEGRIGEEFEIARCVAFEEKNLKKAVAIELDNLIKHLKSINKEINSNSLEAYRFYYKYLDKEMNGLEKLKSIYEVVNKINAKDICVYETSSATPFFDYAIVATVASQRQLNALAGNINEDSAKYGYDIRGVEGANSGEWVLVDAHDVLVNVFTKEAREHYDLDRVWKNLPKVKM